MRADCHTRERDDNAFSKRPINPSNTELFLGTRVFLCEFSFLKEIDRERVWRIDLFGIDQLHYPAQPSGWRGYLRRLVVELLRTVVRTLRTALGLGSHLCDHRKVALHCFENIHSFGAPNIFLVPNIFSQSLASCTLAAAQFTTCRTISLLSPSFRSLRFKDCGTQGKISHALPLLR